MAQMANGWHIMHIHLCPKKFKSFGMNPRNNIPASPCFPSFFTVPDWPASEITQLRRLLISLAICQARGGTKIRKTTRGRIFSLKVWLKPPPPLSSYLKRLFQAKNGKSKYLDLYFIYPPARRAITSTAHLG